MVRRIKAKLVLRLRAEGLSSRQIAAQGMSRHSVAAVLDAADREGIGWDDVADLDEADVYWRLFPGRGEHESVHAQPDWDKVHRELARVGVTLKLLHGEYVDACRGKGETAMGYDRFCKTYQRHVLVIGAASRVGHKAGQTVEVDWSGKTMALTDPVAGQTTRVYLFVGTLPFSRYSFVEPTLDMRQDTWLRAHVSMFDWFGGSVPRVVPDNLKTGVIKHPAEGEVVLNDAYRELAAHYSAAVLPGRLAKPKDKASVEGTVGNVATSVIAALRDRRFATLPELRAAVYERVAAYNAEPFQKRAGSRLSVFEAEEKPILRPLPAVPFEISRW
ncbi:IS21 family transposase, partial [Agromyces bauzanensis]